MSSASHFAGDYAVARGNKSPGKAQSDVSALSSIPSPCRQVGTLAIGASLSPEAPTNKLGPAQALDSATRRLDFDDVAETFAMCDSSSDDADSDELDESYDFDHETIAGLLSAGASRSDRFGSTPEDSAVAYAMPLPSLQLEARARAPMEVLIATPRVERRVASPARPEEARRRRCSGVMGPQRRARGILGRALADATRGGRAPTGLPQLGAQRPSTGVGEDSAQHPVEPKGRMTPAERAIPRPGAQRSRPAPTSTDKAGEAPSRTRVPVGPLSSAARASGRSPKGLRGV